MTTPASNTSSGTNPAPPPAGGGTPPAAGGAPPAGGQKSGGTFLDQVGDGKPAGGETKPDTKPGDEKGEGKGEGKPGEKAAEPAKLEVKFPEGLKLDETKVKAFTELATKHKLDGAAAQALVDFYAEHSSAQEKAGAEAAEAELKSWNAAIAADKDLGGTNLEATKKHASAALKKFATPELRKLLSETGLGSHPEIVRFVVAVGKADADDSVAGSGGGAPDKSEESFLRNLFPSNFQKG